MKPLETLFQSVFVALSAVALAILLRNAPVIRDWVQEMRKPWACNVCLPLYLCALGVGVLYWQSRELVVLLAYFPAYSLSYITLERLGRPPGPPMIPVEMFEEDESD